MWEPFDNGTTIDTAGVDGGIILKDEVTIGARITLEKNSILAPYSITCGIYGLMVHTALFGNMDDATKNYEAMKQEIQAFMDSDIDGNGHTEWCEQFTNKY